MKKVMIIISMLVLSLLVFGCVDYKAYDLKEDTEDDDTSLIDEIALIEEEIARQEESVDLENEENEVIEEVEPSEAVELVEETEEVVEENVVVEEVVLPELKEEELQESEEKKEAPAAELGEVIINARENELVKLKVNIVDPDEDPVNYTFTPPLNKSGMWQTNYGDAGEYVATLAATDGKLTTKKKIKIVVGRVNVAPELKGIKDITVNEGQTIQFEPIVVDPNNDPISVTVSEPLKSGNFVTDHTSAGEYQIKVVASDGELETEKQFKLTIKDVNVRPEISNIADLSIKEGDVVELKPLVTDLDGDDIVLTISEPIGDDGIWETKFIDHGEYAISVKAYDGKETVTKKIRLVIEDINMPPEILDVSLDVN